MTLTITMREALADPNRLGRNLVGDTWSTWRVMLMAAMGEALTDEERALFTARTGRPTEPSERVDELVCIAGRRGGKSRAMAVLACYILALCKHDLAPGERGIVLIASPGQKQSNIILSYCEDRKSVV